MNRFAQRAAQLQRAVFSGQAVRPAGDNAQGITQERQQGALTWGGYQTAGLVNVPAGVYTFPTFFGTTAIPGLASFEQLVDMRYERPTTWAVQLYFQSNGRMLQDEAFNMIWDVNISVGKATNRIQFQTQFTVVTGAELQRVLVTEQIAAQTIQVVPNFLGLTMTTSNRTNSFTWSAWIAPLVQ